MTSALIFQNRLYGDIVGLLVVVERLAPGDECEGSKSLRLELKGKAEFLPNVSPGFISVRKVRTCTIA